MGKIRRTGILTAAEILTMEYGDSPNFMTPHVLKRGKLARHWAYELSWGRGFHQERIYGVSVVQYMPNVQKTKRYFQMSQCFDSEQAAEQHIEDLCDDGYRNNLIRYYPGAKFTDKDSGKSYQVLSIVNYDVLVMADMDTDERVEFFDNEARKFKTFRQAGAKAGAKAGGSGDDTN